jgi:hypothetical protein
MKLLSLMKIVADAQNLGGKLWRLTKLRRIGKLLRKTSAPHKSS